MNRLSYIVASCLLLMQPLSATDVIEHYSVQLDVYVRDEAAVCNRAWQVALTDHSRATVESIMTLNGRQSIEMCIATIYQKASGDVVESRGVEVSRK